MVDHFAAAWTMRLSCVDMACEVGAPVLLVHCGCRAGHTIGHAHRLLRKAVDEIAPRASECGIRLAIKPMHPAASRGWTFLTQLDDCVTFIEQAGHASLGLSLDLWHFAYDEDLPTIIPRIATMMGVGAGGRRHRAAFGRAQTSSTRSGKPAASISLESAAIRGLCGPYRT